MGTVIFEYQTMMSNVLGNMTGRMIPTLQNVSYVLMVICLLLGIYESFAKGGDTRQLAASVLKYVVVAFIVGNWSRVLLGSIDRLQSDGAVHRQLVRWLGSDERLG